MKHRSHPNKEPPRPCPCAAASRMWMERPLPVTPSPPAPPRHWSPESGPSCPSLQTGPFPGKREPLATFQKQLQSQLASPRTRDSRRSVQLLTILHPIPMGLNGPKAHNGGRGTDTQPPLPHEPCTDPRTTGRALFHGAGQQLRRRLTMSPPDPAFMRL